MNNTAPKKVHFIGIAGKGMSATALLLRQLGWEISGSDEGFYPPVSDYLAEANIPFINGYKKENIPEDAEVIVIGKNAKLVPESNEEVRAAFASGKPVKSFPDILEELTAKTDNIVVAGSYGKSTSTALLAWCLKEAEKDPSYFVGEIAKGFKTQGYIGAGGIFVLEGDEYPSSNWDSSSKFLHYHARSVLLTSATHDHINVFPTHTDYLAPFQKLITSLPQDGLLVANGTEEYARALSEKCTGKVVLYGLQDAQWHAEHVVYGMPTSFDLYNGSEKIISLTTSLLGAHNVENIIGISALLLEKKLLTPEELAKGVASFKGVKRRMEYLSPNFTVPVFDGYGSSYEKAKSAVAAMRLHFPTRRLLVIFEPNTITWRSRTALAQYDTAFLGAAKTYIFNPPHDGKQTELTLSDIVARVKSAGMEAVGCETPEEVLSYIEKDLKEDDCILISSSGGMGNLIESVPKLAEKLFPKQ